MNQGSVFMSKSIKAQGQTEQRLDTVQGFRLLADTIPTLCWMADPTGNIYWYNKRWHEYTGLTPGKIKIRYLYVSKTAPFLFLPL